MRNSRAFWPNLITFGNLFFGFWAVVLISQGRYLSGAWLIIAAAILDGVDGAVARMVNASSKFGAEMDSLADVVSFGLAPSVLAYQMLFERMGQPGALIAFLPLAAGAARLARFNVILRERPGAKGFVGMPIPTGALTLVGFFLASYKNPEGVATLPMWLALIPLVALLEVSTFPYRKLPLLVKPDRKHLWQSLLTLAVIASAIIFKPSRVIFPLMLVYALSGPAMGIFGLLVGQGHGDAPHDPVHDRLRRRR
ncbi:MAG: CDP-diacylglycerol--serine O-phosphatidyltransferase [Calditrichaeota bacterium]|nr:CDP-diacylglycerol--serine O-phosphatidyltransferase [Calditrichota bacterium]